MAYMTSETGVLVEGERFIHAEQGDGQVMLSWQGHMHNGSGPVRFTQDLEADL